MNVKNVKWTPEPAHVRRPNRVPGTLVHAAWILSALLIFLWIAAVASGMASDWRIHVLLPAAGLLQAACVVFGFRYGEYLEPMKTARSRIMPLRMRRLASGNTGDRERADAPKPPHPPDA